MRKSLLFIVLVVFPLFVLAQASGGQITRKKANTTTTTHSHTTDKKTQSAQNRLAQQKRAAQLQAERERKERMEQERAERGRIVKTQAERERQEQEARDQAAKEAERTRILQNLINNMVYVEGGTFMMGATSEQGDAYHNEKPAHQVTLSSFSIGRYEVTQEEWHAVMGSNPSYFKGSKRPVEDVSWNDCQEFIRKLNAMTGRRFRLPTEAEWEYAARGGNKSRGYKYAGGNDLNSIAWYKDNSGYQTHEIGGKKPNELGLYDMSGNVWEWCSCWYGSYGSSTQTNPTGPSPGPGRVYRSGGWSYDARDCRVSNRFFNSPDNRFNYLGFRLAQ